MYRDALTRGDENSTAIDRETFVDVCRDYGLALLVDTARLDEEDVMLEASDYTASPEAELHRRFEEELLEKNRRRKLIEADIRAEIREKFYSQRRHVAQSSFSKDLVSDQKIGKSRPSSIDLEVQQRRASILTGTDNQ